MPKISLIRQCLTHLAVAVIFFQLGSMTTSSKCLSLGSTAASGRSEEWDLQLKQRRIRNSDENQREKLENMPKGAIAQKAPFFGRQITSSSSSSSSENSMLTKDFLHGMAWIPREEFVKTFDTGVAIDKAGKTGQNNSVLLLYADHKSLPKGSAEQNNNPVKMLSNPLEATERCDELQIILSSTKRENRCIAIMENWGGSPHSFRFSRYDDSNQLRLGGRFFDGKGGAARWQKPPPRPMTHNFWRQLADFLTHYDKTWSALKPIADKVALAGGKGDPNAKEDGVSRGAITVMVSNYGHAQLLLNFVCAAKSVGFNLDNVLLFAMDQQTYDLAQKLGLASFYPKHLFDGYTPKKDLEKYSFGDGKFALIMMGKVYSVQLVNDLGYDVLFQDLDVIPLRPDIMDYFYSGRKDAADVDMFFQYDKNHNSEQAPYSANSGFYFVKHNQKTNYFFSMLARMGDLVLKSGSHQQAMSVVLGEHMATHGLKVKVMGGEGEDSHLFPNGWHYHRSKNEYMKELKEGKHTPYIFHMNWNNNGKEKQDLMKESGFWFVEDSCHVSNVTDIKACCKA
mmetsp:Transcript_44879/g.108468  ORF Transcript_44879/g.108468 Transcript_44879/m.108468 type:complete len:566 (+) Transcript_44879:184-1881(+)